MSYDLDLIQQLCKELELPNSRKIDRVEISFNQNAVLYFQNAANEEDCLVGFDGTPWHGHNDLMFSDAQGNFIEMNYVDLISGISDGQVLVGERWLNGKVIDRWLEHCDFNDLKIELQCMPSGEELKFFRPTLDRTVRA
jgi:hypothetical protein